MVGFIIETPLAKNQVGSSILYLLHHVLEVLLFHFSKFFVLFDACFKKTTVRTGNNTIVLFTNALCLVLGFGGSKGAVRMQILASLISLGIWGWLKSLSIRIPLISCESSRAIPTFPSTLIKSKLTSFLSKSPTASTAFTAISARWRAQRFTLNWRVSLVSIVEWIEENNKRKTHAKGWRDFRNRISEGKRESTKEFQKYLHLGSQCSYSCLDQGLQVVLAPHGVFCNLLQPPHCNPAANIITWCNSQRMYSLIQQWFRLLQQSTCKYNNTSGSITNFIVLKDKWGFSGKFIEFIQTRLFPSIYHHMKTLCVGVRKILAKIRNFPWFEDGMTSCGK